MNVDDRPQCVPGQVLQQVVDALDPRPRCLGHSTVAITLDVYSHVTPAMNGEAAKVMDELLG